MKVLTSAERETFIRDNTRLMRPPLVPEVLLHLAHELVPIWQMTEEQLEEQGLPPPYWAFAWAGGQALARYVLDHPHTVESRSVLDFGAGSGLAGLAAAKAGAAYVAAADVDAFSITAARLNAQANAVSLALIQDDIIGADRGWDCVLIADMCYERMLSERILAWAQGLARRGAVVLLGDPQRTYFPKEAVEPLASYEVETTRELEDREIRKTGVWRLSPTGSPKPTDLLA